MENEPKIGKEKLVRAIQQGYGFEITNLEFLLRGWGGDCFSVETSDGRLYFLKLHDDANYMGIAVTSRPFYLPLMHQLHNKEILSQIPHPVRTLEGAFSLIIDSCEVVITNFIEGELVGFGELPEPILERLAGMVGILHRSRSQLEFQHPFIEQFEIDFETDLVSSFDALETISTSDNPGKQFLRQTMLPRKGEVLAHLRHLKELQMRVRSINKEMVICHTDLHGGNLITDQQDNLYILDWENALIAPLEHDMIFFAGEKNFWEVFWPNYLGQSDPVEIDNKVLKFYFYRRALEDVAGFVLRILQGDGGEDRDREDINWLIGNLAGFDGIEKTVNAIQDRFAT